MAIRFLYTTLIAHHKKSSTNLFTYSNRFITFAITAGVVPLSLILHRINFTIRIPACQSVSYELWWENSRLSCQIKPTPSNYP